MVFHEPPKRFVRPRTPDQGASITDLPDELLLKILDDIETPEVLKLKETCSSLVPACNTVVQTRRPTLYIHPSPKHLKHALDICSHPVFSQRIERVVLLGKILWHEIRQQPKPMSPNFRFCHWPSQFPKVNNNKSQGGDTTPSETRDPSTFQDAYAPLLDAIAGLPKLKHLGFAEGVREPGLNQVRQAAIDGYAQKAACPSSNSRLTEKEAAALSRLGNPRPWPRNWTDAAAFYGILFDSKLRFESLSLDVELPFIDSFSETLSRSWFCRPGVSPRLEVDGALSAMRDISITVTSGWELSDQQTLYQRLLQHCTLSLENLHISFIPNRAMRGAVTETTLSVVLNGCLFARLKSLELELLDMPAPVVPMGKIAGRRRPASLDLTRRQRPSSQDFDICAFLTHHKTTLTHLRFQNVIFDDSAPTSSPKGPITTIRDVLALMKANSKAEQVEWKVNRYQHDQLCKDPPNFTDCRKFQCGIYCHARWYAIMRSDFEKLALKLGIETKEGSGEWDFGEAFARGSRIPTDEEFEW